MKLAFWLNMGASLLNLTIFIGDLLMRHDLLFLLPLACTCPTAGVAILLGVTMLKQKQPSMQDIIQERRRRLHP